LLQVFLQSAAVRSVICGFCCSQIFCKVGFSRSQSPKAATDLAVSDGSSSTNQPVIMTSKVAEYREEGPKEINSHAEN
jgi:hypothetical protein